MADRKKLAEDLASGLAGWHQLQVTQNLGGFSSEDSARLLVAQIVNAQGQFGPATSQLPPNWGDDTKLRIDVALKTQSKDAVTWYGAIEIKWPGQAFDAHALRMQAVQDAMRVTFIETNLLNARFFIIGGSHDALYTLFDKPHPSAQDRENRRTAFNTLFSRDINEPKSEAVYSAWFKHFPDAGKRIPETIFSGFNGKLKTELLAKSESLVGDKEVGHVYVWQCNRTRGSANSGAIGAGSAKRTTARPPNASAARPKPTSKR